MAQKVTIPWSDGSGDNLYLDFSGNTGESTCMVTSDANPSGIERTEVIEFKTIADKVEDASQVPVKLYIIQRADSLIVAMFDSIVSTYNGKKAGYQPLTE